MKLLSNFRILHEMCNSTKKYALCIGHIISLSRHDITWPINIIKNYNCVIVDTSFHASKLSYINEKKFSLCPALLISIKLQVILIKVTSVMKELFGKPYSFQTKVSVKIKIRSWSSVIILQFLNVEIDYFHFVNTSNKIELFAHIPSKMKLMARMNFGAAAFCIHYRRLFTSLLKYLHLESK